MPAEVDGGGKKNKHARKREQKKQAALDAAGAGAGVLLRAERRVSPGAGQGLFALEAIAAGELVCRAVPALQVVFDAMCAKVCGFCYAPLKHDLRLVTVPLAKQDGRLGVVIDGAKVTGFAPGSPNEHVLQVGDVIEQVDGQSVTAAGAVPLLQQSENPQVAVRRPRLCVGCQKCAFCPRCEHLAAWHEKECALYQQTPPGARKGDTSILRMLLRHRAIEEMGEWTPLSEGKEPVALLRTLQASDTSSLTQQQAEGLAKAAGVSPDLVKELIFQIRTNACQVDRQGRAGCALCVHMGYCNHACAPNTAAKVDDEGFVRLTALKALAPGEEVLISYVDTGLPVQQRKQVLQEHYGFACTCSRCTEES